MTVVDFLDFQSEMEDLLIFLPWKMKTLRLREIEVYLYIRRGDHIFPNNMTLWILCECRWEKNVYYVRAVFSFFFSELNNAQSTRDGHWSGYCFIQFSEKINFKYKVFLPYLKAVLIICIIQFPMLYVLCSMLVYAMF